MRHCLAALVAVSLVPAIVGAQEAPGSSETKVQSGEAQTVTPPPPYSGDAAAQTPAQKKGRYALPFAMRPAIAPDVVRLDGAFVGHNGGFTLAGTITAGGKPFAVKDLGLYARAAFLHNSSTAGTSATAVSNVLAFGLWTPELTQNLRLPVFLGLTAPIGMGGGNSPDVAARAAQGAGIWARQAMDNALFAVNYSTLTAGAGLAWVGERLTAQYEFTLLELIRVRGERVDADAARTNLTMGLSVGYRLAPWLTVSGEVHYQRWLSTPAAVAKDEALGAASNGLRDQLTAGGGVRFNIPLTHTTALRPGLSYFGGLDNPMGKGGYRVVQLDLPIAF